MANPEPQRQRSSSTVRTVILIIAGVLGVCVLGVALLIGGLMWATDRMADEMMNAMDDVEIRVEEGDESESVERAEIGRYELAGRGQEMISMKAAEPTRIGFSVVGLADDENVEPPEKTAVLRSQDGTSSVSALRGASMLFEPTDGTVDLVLENRLGTPIEVQVYRERGKNEKNNSGK